MKGALILAFIVVATPSHADKTTPIARLPAGKYTRCLQCPRKGEQVDIQLHAFRLDRDEVTVGQYEECVKAKRCTLAKKKRAASKDDPVRRVTWNDADTYCKFVGKRLPTEAEWEYAAFPQAPNIDDAPRIGSREPCKALLIAGYQGEKCPGHPHFDGPNTVSLVIATEATQDFVHSGPTVDVEQIYDLYGNVAEWVADWDSFPGDVEDYFKPKTLTNPAGPSSGSEKVVRGGSYAALDGSAEGERRSESPTKRLADVGFRCAGDAK